MCARPQSSLLRGWALLCQVKMNGARRWWRARRLDPIYDATYARHSPDDLLSRSPGFSPGGLAAQVGDSCIDANTEVAGRSALIGCQGSQDRSPQALISGLCRSVEPKTWCNTRHVGFTSVREKQSLKFLPSAYSLSDAQSWTFVGSWGVTRCCQPWLPVDADPEYGSGGVPPG